jgi:hypothetical protein
MVINDRMRLERTYYERLYEQGEAYHTAEKAVGGALHVRGDNQTDQGKTIRLGDGKCETDL